MKNELLKRLSILEKKETPIISARVLRSGGMQGRLHRREIIKFNRDVSSQKKKIKDKLKQIELQKSSDGIIGTQSTEVLEAFNEPIFKRIRKVDGFFS